MEIYIKQREKILVNDAKKLRIVDVAEILSDDRKIEELVVLELEKNNYRTFVVSCIDITKKILEYDKNLNVNIVGLTETIVEYIEKKKKNKVWEILKVGFVGAVLFVGACTAIMSFHNETQIPDVFNEYYKMFFGVETKNAYIIEIPYSIGLAVGIILFFNHAFGKKFTEEATPVEIEMVTYETDQAKAEVKIHEHKNLMKKKRLKNDDYN